MIGVRTANTENIEIISLPERDAPSERLQIALQ